MRRNRVVLAAAAACAVEFILGTSAHAAVRTWSATTSSSDSNFSDAVNWGGTGPVSGTDGIAFNGTPANTNLTPTNDIVGLTLASNSLSGNQYGLNISGGKSYTLSGNDLTIICSSATVGAMTNTATVLETINNNMIFGGSSARVILSSDSAGTTFGGTITNVSLTGSVLQFESNAGTIAINGVLSMSTASGQALNIGNTFNTTNGTTAFNNNITGNATLTVGRGTAIVNASTDLVGAVNIGNGSAASSFNASLNLANTGALQNATSFSILRNNTGGQTGGTDSLLIAANGTERDQNITIYAQTNSGVTVAIGGTTGLSSGGTAIFGGNITYGLSTASNNIVNRTLQLQATEGTVTFKGTLKEGTVGQSTGLLSINKSGAGTVILSGANTYSGTTSVSAGTLLVNNTSGSGTSSGAVMVAGDATLGGKGTIGGTVTVAGTSGHLSILNPGDSAHTGTLTMNGGVTLGDYSNLAINLSGSNSNALAITGDLNLSSLLDNLTFTGTADGTTHYVIASYTGTLTGTFNNVFNVPSGYTVDYNAGQIVLAPEPGSLALLAAGQLGVLSLRRRRRRPALRTA